MGQSRKHPVTDRQILEVRRVPALGRRGLSVRQIAVELGRSLKLVGNVLRDAGVG